jgi:ligand-binding SRPBCC domain-containing protein
LKVHELRTEIHLPRPREEVFEFFADAGNLQAITPDWLHFRILTPLPIEMRQGALIEYRLRLRGLPVRWKTEITAWDPPRRFVDEQLRGPYRLWVHEHTFQEADGGTLVGDSVRYAVPGGTLVDKLFVAREVRRIFAFRQERLRETLGQP